MFYISFVINEYKHVRSWHFFFYIFFQTAFDKSAELGWAINKELNTKKRSINKLQKLYTVDTISAEWVKCNKLGNIYAIFIGYIYK